MKLLCFCLLLLIAGPCCGQAPQPTPAPPFRLNFRVIYVGAKDRPDLASFIYKSLRELPGVGVVDRDPDAILIVNEVAQDARYACNTLVLIQENADLRLIVDGALMAFDGEQSAKEALGETTEESGIKSYWRKTLNDGVRRLPPIYRYEGGSMVIDSSPKAALSRAIKNLGATYVEKERRAYDYSLAHPYIPFQGTTPIYGSTPTPAPQPIPQPWTPPSRDFLLTTPTPTPVPLY